MIALSIMLAFASWILRREAGATRAQHLRATRGRIWPGNRRDCVVWRIWRAHAFRRWLSRPRQRTPGMAENNEAQGDGLSGPETRVARRASDGLAVLWSLVYDSMYLKVGWNTAARCKKQVG
jgi:hypothetical protein